MALDRSVLRAAPKVPQARMVKRSAAPALASLAGALVRVVVMAVVCVPSLLNGAHAAHAAPRAESGSSNETRAWTSAQARELAKEAVQAKKDGNPQRCVEKNQASLALEDQPYTKLHLAGCLQITGKLVDALAKARDALAAGIRSGDDDLQRAARARVADLLARLAHVTLRLPKDASGIKVTFDNVPVRSALFRTRVAVDPGDHVIEAERTQNGEREFFKERISLAQGADKTIEIVLKTSHATEGEILCLQNAASYEEKLACVERKSTKPNVHVGLQMSGYTDTTSVHVFTPAINASVVSPTGGWNVGGSYLVDVLSAASPDIVSMASPPYRETRHAASLNGGYSFGTVAVSGNGNVSSEPDYLSMTGGAAASMELNDKLITPRLGYNFTRDRIGIRNTPFSQFERNLTTHQMEAGVTFVLSPTTLLVTGGTAQFERGEESKLYRYVPTFSPEAAATVSPGESAFDVNSKRLSVRAREVLPRERDRFALGVRINHRFTSGTLRVEERGYIDTWGIKASTTDARYFHDLGDHLRVWPHLRYHVQTGASFYRLAYPALIDQDGIPLQLYAYRTGDRELSPMMTFTLGGGSRIALTNEKARTQYAVIFTGDLMHSIYSRALFITNRTAIYGTIGFEADF